MIRSQALMSVSVLAITSSLASDQLINQRLLLINRLLHHFERVVIHQPNTWLSYEWRSEMDSNGGE